MVRVMSIITTARKARKAKRASAETKEVAVADTVAPTTTSENTTKMRRVSLSSRMRRPITATMLRGDSRIVEVSAVVAEPQEAARLEPTTESSAEATEVLPVVADPGPPKSTRVQEKLEKPSLKLPLEVKSRLPSQQLLLSEER
jgi:hypothetical protein